MPSSLTCLSGLVVAVGLTGCAVDASPPPPPSSSPLHIDVHDDQLLSGTYRAGELTVAFRAVSPRPLYGFVEVTLGDDTLQLSADADTGELEFDAGLAVLSELEHGALVSWSRELAGYLGEVDDVSVMHDSLLLAASQYFAVAPVGEPLRPSFHLVEGLGDVVATSTSNDGKTCVKRGQSVTAQYDGNAGTTSETWTVGAHGGTQWSGNYECMGRCGAGCGSYDWTLDCLEHDACSRRYYSTAGAVDQNCGDEFSEAADDYTAFWKRCY